MSDPIALVLGIINTVRLGAGSVAFQHTAGNALAIELKAHEFALQDGVADGIRVDDFNARVEGLTTDDLKKPDRDLVQRLRVELRHLTVRISRDWLNSALAREPMLAEKGVKDVQIIFPPERNDVLMVRASIKGMPVQVTIRLGISENRVIVILDGVQLLGLLPVPRWLRNFVLNMVRERLEGLPCVKYTEGTFEINPLSVSPVAVEARLGRLVTRGKYLVVEAGEV